MSAKNTLWMCVALAAAIVAAWLVVVLGTPTKPAEAAFPGRNGKIAFVSGSEIVTMNANGDNKSKLTNNDPQVYDIDPVFSANGRKIAFASDRTGKRDIYVINQDGSGLTRITTSPKPDTQPAWSPDGTKIAFRRDWINSSWTVGVRAHTTIFLTVQPWVPPETVEVAYRQLQKKIIGGECGRIGDKNLKLLQFVANRADANGNLPKGVVLVQEWDRRWNREHPEWCYGSDKRRFCRDFRSAQRNVTNSKRAGLFLEAGALSPEEYMPQI
jgi:hypothetical protein